MSDPSQRRINPWSVWALIAIMIGAVPVTYAWLKTLSQQAESGRPPMLRPVKRSLEADVYGGDKVRLFAKDGRLYLVGYCYFGDEVEALDVCKRQQAMFEPFADEERVHLVTISMAPDLDTPEVVEAFKAKHGFGGERWLFVGGDRQRIRDYMNKWLRFPGHEKPDEFRETDTDLYARELRISLIDGIAEGEQTAFVRGVYWTGVADGEVRNDSTAEAAIRFILDQADGKPVDGKSNEGDKS